MHIPILALAHLVTECTNRKGCFSMVMQMLVDHQGHFPELSTLLSVKLHDIHIFKNTGFLKNLQAETFFLDH